MSELAQVSIGDAVQVMPHGIQIQLVDTYYDLQDLTKQNPEHLEFLKAVVGYMSARHKVTLSLGEADSLYDKVALEYHRKKKAARTAIDAIYASPAGTDSTPST